MTIREHMEKMLFERVVWPGEATAIMDAIAAGAPPPFDALFQSMDGRWKDETTEYPPVLTWSVSKSVRLFARHWLKERKPKHIAIHVIEAEDGLPSGSEAA